MAFPSRAQVIEILKRSAVTFAATFVASFAVALNAAPSRALVVLWPLALSSAAGAVNVVIRTIWKPELVTVSHVFVPVVVPAVPAAPINTPEPAPSVDPSAPNAG